MTAPASDFHDDETTTSYRDEITLCGATPTCAEPGAFSDASGHAACREHGGVAPRNLPADVRRLVASAATRRDYGAIARILGDADVDLAWLAEELTQTARPRAHALAVDLVRLGVEPHLLVPALPPTTVAESPRAQIRRQRLERVLQFATDPESLPDELRECYRRHGEVLAERDALKRRVEELEARVAALEEERDGLAAGLRQALTYDQFSDL